MKINSFWWKTMIFEDFQYFHILTWGRPLKHQFCALNQHSVYIKVYYRCFKKYFRDARPSGTAGSTVAKRLEPLTYRESSKIIDYHKKSLIFIKIHWFSSKINISHILTLRKFPNSNRPNSANFLWILKISIFLNKKLSPLERRLPELSFFIWISSGIVVETLCGQ